MKLNKLLAVVLVAAFALPVMAQNGPGPAPAGAHGPVHKPHHAKKHVRHKKHHHVKKHHM